MADQSRESTLPDSTHLGRTVLTVENNALAEFYVETVGFEVLTESTKTTVLGVGNKPILELIEDENAMPRHTRGTGLFHNAFRVPSSKALADALIRIEDSWQLTGASDHFVSEALYLRDPEGNGIEIYRDFPRSEWPIREGGQINIGTEPLDLDTVRSHGKGTDKLPSGTDLGHIHLEVSSVGSSRSFYAETLGLDVMMELPNAVFMAAGGYHHHVAVNSWNHRSRQCEGHGIAWFELVIPERSAFDEVCERIESSGLRVSSLEGYGVRVFDPDGIPVHLRWRPAD